MPFVITQDNHTQRDGRRYVREVHSDAQGEFARVEYLAAPGTDTNAVATAREPQLIASNAEAEARRIVDNRELPNVRFQTVDELLAKVRARYLISTGMDTCRIARWIVDRLDDSSITVVQCRTAWGASPVEWNTINGTMDVYRAAINSVEVAVGE